MDILIIYKTQNMLVMHCFEINSSRSSEGAPCHAPNDHTICQINQLSLKSFIPALLCSVCYLINTPYSLNLLYLNKVIYQKANIWVH